jgi:acyl-CoA hydrolase
MIFVAMSPEGRSTPVSPWQPITDDDRAQQASAQRRIALRADIETAMAAQRYTADGTAPVVLLRFLAAPTDINWGGKVHGGIVMRWIDETAHVLASRWTASTGNVAVYAGGVRFYQPLLIGHLVEVEARLLLTRANSMHISVHVRSGPATSGELALTTHCLIVFAPADSAHRVPLWDPVSAEDKALEEHALHLVRLRARVAS